MYRSAAVLKRLVAVTLFSCVVATIAHADRAPLQLDPGDGFVIARATGKLLDRALFEQVDGKNSFFLERNDDGVLLRVKAGRYYLKVAKPRSVNVNAMPRNMNVDPIAFAAPDVDTTLDIREGVISCIGDWSFNWPRSPSQGDPSMEWQMNEKTVEYVRQRNNTDTFPIYVVRVGQPPAKLALK